MDSKGRFRVPGAPLARVLTMWMSLVGTKPEEVLGREDSVPVRRALASAWVRRSLARSRDSSCWQGLCG